MDPDAAYDEIANMLRTRKWVTDIERFRDLVEGLQEWLQKGGFPPRRRCFRKGIRIGGELEVMLHRINRYMQANPDRVIRPEGA